MKRGMATSKTRNPPEAHAQRKAGKKDAGQKDAGPHSSGPHSPGPQTPGTPGIVTKGNGAAGGGAPDPRGAVLVIVHQAHSTPGRIGERLEKRGYRLDVRRPALGDSLPEHLGEHQAVVVFGGPMSANDELPFIRAEIDFMEQALKAGLPLLGICLGAQMMARALGARVSPHHEGECEIGYYPLRPTELGSSMLAWPSHVYHWHSEGFELPSGADLLATGATFPNQAFRYGETAYGLQFHPEVTREMMCRWTTKGAHHLTRRGAQPGEAHLEGWGRYDGAVCRWLDGFLDTWLGKGTRPGRDAREGEASPPLSAATDAPLVPGVAPRLVPEE